MVQIEVTYEGDLHCSSSHLPSGSQLPTDAPADNMGRGAAFSPTDLTASSLGSCMLTTMAIVARKQNLPYELNGSGVTVRKHMTAEPPRRIAKIEAEVRLAAPASSEVKETLEKAALNCPVALSLHPDVEKAVTFQWPTA